MIGMSTNDEISKKACLFQIQEDLELAKSDIKKGRVVDHETVMAEIKNRYL